MEFILRLTQLTSLDVVLPFINVSDELVIERRWENISKNIKDEFFIVVKLILESIYFFLIRDFIDRFLVGLSITRVVPEVPNLTYRWRLLYKKNHCRGKHQLSKA